LSAMRKDAPGHAKRSANGVGGERGTQGNGKDAYGQFQGEKTVKG